MFCAWTVTAGNPFQVDVRIFDSEGMLVLDLERTRAAIRHHDGNQVSVPLRADAGDSTREGPPHGFVELILGRSDRNNSSGEIGVRVVDVLDAAYCSAVSGQAVLLR